ncbi:MAG: ABC transporter substrate-binding protein [Alphaproteobacteria bacterium]|nr:ABC transporter substrate-binding protein [Alphaproteobacteria bacterium]NNF24672.1 ABC transporter substrate-binding protein [Paracoccaceae bacterium]
MRIAAIAGGLIFALWSGALLAFEVEDHKIYAADPQTDLLRIISTADLDAFAPIIEAYQAANPGVTVDYTIASSTELMAALYDERAAFDLAISSAMDLQTKLANDGLAQSYASAATGALPDWAKWRDQVFGFTQEPAVLVISQTFFAGTEPPRSREALINLLRNDPERFRGRIGTYDVRVSGLGYLFATQDSRNSESFWRLTELMGGLDAQLYCCSGDMISDVAGGRLAFAYNVLGSYAESRIADTAGIEIVELEDFLSVMLRTALIPNTAENVEPARAMIDFLAGLSAAPRLTAASGLPPIDEESLRENNALRPIRLGPGLLVFLDRLKRETFLRSWTSAIEQSP